MIGYVYTIICSVSKKQYIGSTFMSIQERYLWHCSVMNKCSSKAIISPNSSVMLLEEAAVESKAELRLLERKWFDISANVVNKNRPFRTEAEKKTQLVEYRAAHADYFKTYRDNAAVKWKQPVACDCGGRYTLMNKITHMKRKKHCVYISNYNSTN